MQFFIDKEYRCYSRQDNAGSLRSVESDAFDGKCATYLNGFCFIPKGESWTREDGEIFEGESVFPWKDSQMLELAQAAYEESLAEMQDMQEALNLLGVNANG